MEQGPCSSTYIRASSFQHTPSIFHLELDTAERKEWQYSGKRAMLVHVHAAPGTDQANQECQWQARQVSPLTIPVALRRPEVNTCSTLTTSCSGARLAVWLLHPIPSHPSFLPSSSHHRTTASPTPANTFPHAYRNTVHDGPYDPGTFAPFLLSFASYIQTGELLRQPSPHPNSVLFDPTRSDISRPKASLQMKNANKSSYAGT